MEWKIEFRADINCLYICTSGILTPRSADDMFRDIVLAAEKYRCNNQIVDHRETVFDFDIMDYYQRPSRNKRLGLSHIWKIAMIFKELTSETQFMENVFRNRGYNFRQFSSFDEALAWIQKNE